MVRTGTEARCERCGKIEFFPDNTRCGDSRYNWIAESGWRLIGDKSLCRDCTKAYDALIEQFFNEIWDK